MFFHGLASVTLPCTPNSYEVAGWIQSWASYWYIPVHTACVSAHTLGPRDDAKNVTRWMTPPSFCAKNTCILVHHMILSIILCLSMYIYLPVVCLDFAAAIEAHRYHFIKKTFCITKAIRTDRVIDEFSGNLMHIMSKAISVAIKCHQSLYFPVHVHR